MAQEGEDSGRVHQALHGEFGDGQVQWTVVHD